ncbi:MAG: hypothetical protein LBB77_05080 [Treponema sp.]|jgi:hypothetical protein|nr:hypothetical protein [Treponema sp.]
MKGYIRFFLGLAVCMAGLVIISCSNGGGGGIGDDDEDDNNRAEAQAAIGAGHDALAAENYDAAIGYYRTAYEKDSTNPEAITYSVLAELAAVSIDGNVRNLIRDRLGVVNYPGTMGALFSTEWMAEYTDEGFSEFFPGLAPPDWFQNTDVYKNSLTNIGGNAVQSVTTFPLLLAANLLDKNTSGLNILFADILNSVFGSKFENIAARVGNLSPDAVITLDAKVTAALGLDELLEGDGLKIGKPELDVLIASIRIVKATFEWIASYNWDSDFTFLKFDWTSLDDFKAKLSAANVASLPFRSGFLKSQDPVKLNAAKTDYLIALAAISGAYDAIWQKDYIPPAVKDEMDDNGWIKDGIDKLRIAIGNGAKFWVPKDLPSGQSWNVSEADAIFGIDTGKLFTVDNVTLSNMVEMSGDNPVFYGFISGKETKITSSIQIDGGNFEMLGFRIKLDKIKELVPGAFDDNEFYVQLFPVEIGKALYNKYYP